MFHRSTSHLTALHTNLAPHVVLGLGEVANVSDFDLAASLGRGSEDGEDGQQEGGPQAGEHGGGQPAA